MSDAEVAMPLVIMGAPRGLCLGVLCRFVFCSKKCVDAKIKRSIWSDGFEGVSRWEVMSGGYWPDHMLFFVLVCCKKNQFSAKFKRIIWTDGFRGSADERSWGGG